MEHVYILGDMLDTAESAFDIGNGFAEGSRTASCDQ